MLTQVAKVNSVYIFTLWGILRYLESIQIPWCANFKPRLYIIGSCRPPVTLHLEEFDTKFTLHDNAKKVFSQSLIHQTTQHHFRHESMHRDWTDAYSDKV